ncbi:hypothetical protein [Secundilactobacillus kimchicus]|uniref:hypothetical protein n=1 Tax=Secundilactobacillus kimchicus TaxID=528209 RepID=UPI0024A7CE43|nr:hypothetical protein [Secundilactobacillus kimchicus]
MMTKVWQFPNGEYISNIHGEYNPATGRRGLSVEITKSIEEAQQFEDSNLSKWFAGKAVEYEEPLILTGTEILVEAVNEWSKYGNQDKEDWNSYWHGAFGSIKPDKRYKTNSDFSYFEEVAEDE